ncbi:MAG: M28 family peptidase [Acidobacteriota bacterium]
MTNPFTLIRSRDLPAVPRNEAATELARRVSEEALRDLVVALSIPRHHDAEPAANARTRDFVAARLASWGYAVEIQGPHGNVLAASPGSEDRPSILLGAHYDSVPGSPGADDNASAVALCLECARLLAGSPAPVRYAFFNREEDHLLGSIDLVSARREELLRSIALVHVFEMVGYTDRRPGSQRAPQGLPVALPDVADFLGILGNQQSNHIVERVVHLAASHVPDTATIGLQIFGGAERAFRDLLRSDHVPFWEAGIPALMWTDTSEFRNPNYHRPTDLPETLNYGFLANVTRLALCHICAAARDP